MADTKKPAAVTNLRQLANKRQTKIYRFMGESIEINKLTLVECTEIQKVAKDLDPENPDKSFDLLKHIIRVGVPAASDFEDHDFDQFAMDDLNKLSDAVLAYAGMDPNRK